MNDADELDDMPIVVRVGYDRGIEFMDTVTSAAVFGMNGGRINNLPDISNADPDYVRGFNAAVSDYIQDKDVDWMDIFTKRLNSFYIDG